jgi:hypothetical protein
MPQSYLSPSSTFSFEYPEDWKLEKEEQGVLKLHKKSGLLKKESLNSLRIKPLISAGIIAPAAYKSLLALRKKEHKDLTVVEFDPHFVMNFHILRYQKESYEDVGERTFLFYQDFWELVISNRIFTCWFSLKQGEEHNPAALEEKASAEQILYTIKLL